MACKCLNSKIIFNTDALEKMAYEPEWVLENQEEYWSSYLSQKYTRDWAEQVNHEINYEKWRKTIEEWSKTPPSERRKKDFLTNTEKIIEGKTIFLKKALPHVCSYLPEEAELDICVHFTAYVPPRAFAMGEIVINMTATYWNNNSDNILNTIVHELFHVGYSYCRDRWNVERDDSLFGILENIHNEGICTYVAYMAQDIFPAPDEKDFQMLDDLKVVKYHINEVREIFNAVNNVSEGELQNLCWDKGVIGRSFYVVGAYMCKIIDDIAGKNSIKSTLLEGPVSFFNLYNKLAPSDMNLHFQ
jgi:hypothetical protein